MALTDGGRALTGGGVHAADGRGNGSPLASLVELPSGAKIVQVFASKAERRVLLATSDGYGFLCRLGDMTATKRAGKQFMSVDEGARLLPPLLFDGTGAARGNALSSGGKLLIFPIDQMKELSGGGRGNVLMGLDEAGPRRRPAWPSLTLLCNTRGGKPSNLGCPATGNSGSASAPRQAAPAAPGQRLRGS